MSFKRFLLEMPYFGSANLQVPCPENDIINSEDQAYKIDYLLEAYALDDKKQRIPSPTNTPEGRRQREIYEEMNKFVGAPGEPFGIWPIYCKVHDLLFTYNFDENEAIKYNDLSPELKTDHDIVRKCIGLGQIYHKDKITDIRVW